MYGKKKKKDNFAHLFHGCFAGVDIIGQKFQGHLDPNHDKFEGLNLLS